MQWDIPKRGYLKSWFTEKLIQRIEITGINLTSNTVYVAIKTHTHIITCAFIS
jgi:hypothetical protein